MPEKRLQYSAKSLIGVDEKYVFGNGIVVGQSVRPTFT